MCRIWVPDDAVVSLDGANLRATTRHRWASSLKVAGLSLAAAAIVAVAYGLALQVVAFARLPVAVRLLLFIGPVLLGLHGLALWHRERRSS